MGEGIVGKGFHENKLKITTAIIAAVIALSAFNIFASYGELELFDQGYEYYLSYRPEKAVETFTLFIKEFPSSPARDAAMFWMGKALINLRLFDSAKTIFWNIKREFPASPLVKYADKELEGLGKADEVIVTTPPVTKEEDQIAQTHTDKVTDSSIEKPSPTTEETQKQGSLPTKELAKNETADKELEGSGKADEVIVTTSPVTKEEEKVDSQIVQAQTDKAIDPGTEKPSATTEENQNQASLPMTDMDKSQDLAMESLTHEERRENPSGANAPPNKTIASEETPNIFPSLQDTGEKPPDLETEVSLFLSRYTSAYEEGDIWRFMNLFSNYAIENNSLHYADIRKYYASNFEGNRYNYTLGNVRIEKREDSIIVRGDYGIRKITDDDKATRAQGIIRWTLTREEGILKILRIDYEKM